MFGSHASGRSVRRRRIRVDDVLSLSSVLIVVADQIWRDVSGPIGFFWGSAAASGSLASHLR
jgi:hypothetical protein